jgi:hypothetical protein
MFGDIFVDNEVDAMFMTGALLEEAFQVERTVCKDRANARTAAAKLSTYSSTTKFARTVFTLVSTIFC